MSPFIWQAINRMNSNKWYLLFLYFLIFFYVCLLFWVFCVFVFFLCIVSPFVYSCLFPIVVQVYRPLPPGGNSVAVNKYRIYFWTSYIWNRKAYFDVWCRIYRLTYTHWTQWTHNMRSRCWMCIGASYTGCPTRYLTRHFFNNFTTNEDIATKFEAVYRNIPLHFSHNERTFVQISLTVLVTSYVETAF